MAQTLEQALQQIIGSHVITNTSLQIRVAELTEQLQSAHLQLQALQVKYMPKEVPVQPVATPLPNNVIPYKFDK
jgi:hypothetical protein